MATIKAKRKAPAHDPATDPAEKGEVETLLAVSRPGVTMLVALALDKLSSCKAALDLARLDPLERRGRARGESGGELTSSAAVSSISANNSDAIDRVVDTYQKLLEKVRGLPLDQAATDYPTFARDARGAGVQCLWSASQGAHVFRPRALQRCSSIPCYRPFDATVREPFSGLTPIALQGVQLREMCHFYLNIVDGNPAVSSTAQCLNLGAELPAVRDPDRTRPPVAIDSS